MSVQDENSHNNTFDLLFKYIVCVGSSFAFFGLLGVGFGLNTSYVSVQEEINHLNPLNNHSLNTSYVSVQAFAL